MEGYVPIFLIFAQKQRLWVPEAVLMCTHNKCFEQKHEKYIKKILLKIFNLQLRKICILHWSDFILNVTSYLNLSVLQKFLWHY